MANDDGTMSNVPESNVGEYVQRFINWDQATNIRCEKTNDGSWKIVAQ